MHEGFRSWGRKGLWHDPSPPTKLIVCQTASGTSALPEAKQSCQDQRPLAGHIVEKSKSTMQDHSQHNAYNISQASSDIFLPIVKQQKQEHLWEASKS